MSVKHWIMAAALACASFSSQNCCADTFSGEKSLGLRVGYNTYNREPLGGIQFSFRFNKLLRIAPDVDYVFRRDGRDALLLNLNMEFLFPLAQGQCAIYPLVGLNYSSWNYHRQTGVSAAGTNDVSSRISRAGLNAGAGFDVNITGSLRLSVTAGYTFIKEFHGANIAAGIHYRF